MTPLSVPPVPPNQNMERAMFVWGDNPGSTLDPLGTLDKQKSLLMFCELVGVNVLFLDIWSYLGGNNWSVLNRDAMQQFVGTAHASGIRVHALAGNTDWGHNLQWVARNILRRIAEFNLGRQRFDGLLLDVEYYTVENYNAQAELPGLLDLLVTAKQVLNIPVGVFATHWLLNGQMVTYAGASKKEGWHLLDVADHIVVGCYSCNDGTPVGVVQRGQFQPWYDYARATPGAARLWCGSETALGAPLGYLGKTKLVMEASHTVLSQAFANPGNLVFRGQAIHAYSTYAVMG